MWYVLKVDFVSQESPNRQSKMVGHDDLESAQRIFDHLELSYLFDSPVRIKGGKKIKIEGLTLLESFKEHYADALAATASGNTTIMRQARELDLDI